MNISFYDKFNEEDIYDISPDFKEILIYLFNGEDTIYNLTSGEMFNWFQQQDKSIKCIFNAIVIPDDFIQINALDEADNVCLRVKFFTC